MFHLLLSMITAGGIGLVTPTDSGTVHRPQTLEDYVAAAQRYSPLIKEQHLQTAANAAELERLRAVYLRSRLELNGDFLFVPIVETTGGRTSFKWNAQSATDYYGYDLGESSGHFHAGATWTQPLLGRQAYAAAKWQTQVDTDIAANRIRIERHELRRAVTEQYLLCLLDSTQTAFVDSIVALLAHQSDVVKRLAVAGLATTSDLRLLDAERTAAEEQVTTQRTNYHTHLMELRLLCGITDTTATELAATDIALSAAPSSGAKQRQRFHTTIPARQPACRGRSAHLRCAIPSTAQPLRRRRRTVQPIQQRLPPLWLERGPDVQMDALRRPPAPSTAAADTATPRSTGRLPPTSRSAAPYTAARMCHPAERPS